MEFYSGYNQYGGIQSSPKLEDVQDVQKAVGKRVRESRLKSGLTQDELAFKSGLHRAHVGEIERGESNVTIQTLKTVADTLKMKIVDILKDI